MSDGVTRDMTAMPRTTVVNASTSVLKKERGYRVRMKAAVTLTSLPIRLHAGKIYAYMYI